MKTNPFEQYKAQQTRFAVWLLVQVFIAALLCVGALSLLASVTVP